MWRCEQTDLKVVKLVLWLVIFVMAYLMGRISFDTFVLLMFFASNELDRRE